MTVEKTKGNRPEKTTLNISLSVGDKKFLKVYAAQNGTTVSSLIQDYIETLKAEDAGETTET